MTMFSNSIVNLAGDNDNDKRFIWFWPPAHINKTYTLQAWHDVVPVYYIDQLQFITTNINVYKVTEITFLTYMDSIYQPECVDT